MPVVVQIIAWVQQCVIPIWTSIHGIHRIQIVLRVQTVFFASFFIEPHFVAVDTFFGPIRYLIQYVQTFWSDCLNLVIFEVFLSEIFGQKNDFSILPNRTSPKGEPERQF